MSEHASAEVADRLISHIRSIPDFPKPGILFRDITTLLQDANAFREAVRALCEPYRSSNIDSIAAIEARGFVFGGAMAVELGAGLVPVRKVGKLPYRTRQQTYDLEYGTDILEVHEDAVTPEARVLVVDDLLATGGTAAATIDLVRSMGAQVIGVAFLVELIDLHGRDRLSDCEVFSVIQFEGE